MDVAKRRTRTMTPDLLAKLAIARVAAAAAKQKIALESHPAKVEKMQKRLDELKMADPEANHIVVRPETEPPEPIAPPPPPIKPAEAEIPKEPVKPILADSEDDEPEPPKREKKKKKKGKTTIIQESSSSSSSSDEDNHVIYIKKKKNKKHHKYEKLRIPKPQPVPPPPEPPIVLHKAEHPYMPPIPTFGRPVSRFARRF